MASRKNRRTLKKRGKKSKGGFVTPNKNSNSSNLYPGKNPPQKPDPTPVPTPTPPEPKPTQTEPTQTEPTQKEKTYYDSLMSLFGPKTGGKKRSKTIKRRRR